MDYRDILATRLKPFRIEAYENYVINGLTYIQSSSTILEQLNYEKSRSLDVSLYMPWLKVNKMNRCSYRSTEAMSPNLWEFCKTQS